MRMGATILGAAASSFDLGLSSAVLWDPCESGRAFLREVEILAALGRDGICIRFFDVGKAIRVRLRRRRGQAHRQDQPDETRSATAGTARSRDSTRRSECVQGASSRRGSQRTSNGPRPPSREPCWKRSCRNRCLPISTNSRIESWLSEEPSARIPYRGIALTRDALVTRSPNAYPVRETFVEMGTRKLFGVVCEPVGESHGPLIVMVNGINEDHVGPSRLWVELSRRWAGYGLRTVRFDFRGIGESPPTE